MQEGNSSASVDCKNSSIFCDVSRMLLVLLECISLFLALAAILTITGAMRSNYSQIWGYLVTILSIVITVFYSVWYPVFWTRSEACGKMKSQEEASFQGFTHTILDSSSKGMGWHDKGNPGFTNQPAVCSGGAAWLQNRVRIHRGCCRLTLWEISSLWRKSSTAVTSK